MYKAAVVGEKDTVLGYRTLGLDVFPVIHSEDAKKVLEELVKEPYAVIYVTEQTAGPIMDYIRGLKTRMLPAVILIPGNKGSLGIAAEEIRKSVEKAVGADIL